MKRTLLYLFASLLASLAILFVFDRLLQIGFNKSTEEVSGKMNLLLNDTSRYDMLCLGSSRALAHLESNRISQKTGMRVYNGGINGARVASMKILFEGFLKSHPAPSVLVLHLDEFTLETEKMLEVPHYLPFLPNHQIKQEVFAIEPDLAYLQYVPFFRVFYYDDLKKWIAIKSLFELGNKGGEPEHGFSNLADSGWSAYWESQYGNRLKVISQPYDSIGNFDLGLSMLDSILRLAKSHGVKVVFTSSPLLGGSNIPKYEACVRAVESSCKRNGLDAMFFWMHRTEWDRKEYYYDLVHMVRKGARLYSDALSDSICATFPADCISPEK
ncbi:MAG: hypothetical protein ACKOX7_00595 [Bacteroidota bacterium]